MYPDKLNKCAFSKAKDGHSMKVVMNEICTLVGFYTHAVIRCRHFRTGKLFRSVCMELPFCTA